MSETNSQMSKESKIAVLRQYIQNDIQTRTEMRKRGEDVTDMTKLIDDRLKDLDKLMKGT